VRVVMITGDHPATAQAIARAAGIRADAVMTGVELADLSDEAFAAGVRTGDRARIVAAAPGTPARAVLVTERDVVRIAREGGTLPPRALLTPSARDRARALGLEQ